MFDILKNKKFALILLITFIIVIILAIASFISQNRTSTKSKASVPPESQNSIRVIGKVMKVDPCIENLCFKIDDEKTLKSYFLKEKPQGLGVMRVSKKKISVLSATGSDTTIKTKATLADFVGKNTIVRGTVFTQPVVYILIDKIAYYQKPPCMPKPQCLYDAKPCQLPEPDGGWCAESAVSVCNNLGLKSSIMKEACIISGNSKGYKLVDYTCYDNSAGTLGGDGETCFTLEQLKSIAENKCKKVSSCFLSPTPGAATGVSTLNKNKLDKYEK